MKVYMQEFDHSYVFLENEEAVDATQVAHLCYQAMLAIGYSPSNVAEAFMDVGTEHYEALVSD